MEDLRIFKELFICFEMPIFLFVNDPIELQLFHINISL